MEGRPNKCMECGNSTGEYSKTCLPCEARKDRKIGVYRLFFEYISYPASMILMGFIALLANKTLG